MRQRLRLPGAVWQIDADAQATSSGVGGADLTAVRLNGPAGNRQTQAMASPHSVAATRERLKNAVQLVCGNPATVVQDVDLRLPAAQRRFDVNG